MCPYRSPSLQDCSFAGNRARGRGSSGRLGRQDLVGPVTSSAVQAPAMLVPLGDPVNGHVGSPAPGRTEDRLHFPPRSATVPPPAPAQVSSPPPPHGDLGQIGRAHV